MDTKENFEKLFDKNFKHAQEQLVKASLFVNNQAKDEFEILFSLAENLDSSNSSAPTNVASLHHAKNIKADLSPINKELLKLLLNENSIIGEVFWHSFAKCHSQQDSVYSNLDSEGLISILQMLDESNSEELFKKFRDFIATNGLLRSSSHRHLEYSSISNEDGQSSLFDLIFDLDFFKNFITDHKNILLDILLFSMGINPHIDGSYREDFHPAIKDKKKLSFLSKKGLIHKPSKSSSEKYDEYMRHGKNVDKYLNELSSSGEDDPERSVHNEFRFAEELVILQGKFYKFENLFKDMMRVNMLNSRSIMNRKESFSEIFIQEMSKNHHSEWENFKKGLMLNGVCVDYENFDDPYLDMNSLLETVFQIFFSYLRGLLKSLNFLSRGVIKCDLACYLLELKNPKTILNAIADENGILKWSEIEGINKKEKLTDIDYQMKLIDFSSFLEWGLDKKRKNRLLKILSFKDLTKSINLHDLVTLKDKLDNTFNENSSSFDFNREDLLKKIKTNKYLGQLTSDESQILDKVFGSLEY